MKCSINWIKDYTDVGIPVEKLAHRLTMAGMEVEKIEAVGKDKVFELEITPNRPDCLNMIGLARETAAVLNNKLRLPKTKKFRVPSKKADVTIKDAQDCGRYIGTVIRDVKVGPSPDWVQQRLMSVGLRPINNIVDITNFVLLETGQPLHAFDYDKLLGKKIIVRRARGGEKILTLDGEEKALDDSVLIIADDKRPVAVAGIMGGEETQVTEATRRILLESASFNSVIIRRATRLLGLFSDSSYRFERGVDIHNTAEATVRAVSLILEIAGGAVEQYKDLFPGKKVGCPAQIKVDLGQIKQALGAPLTAARMKTILTKLGCAVKAGKKNSFTVIPPSFRQDLRLPPDIVEEVARIIGYDNLPMALPSISYSSVPQDECRQFKLRIMDLLQGAGLHQVISYSLISREACTMSRLDPEKCLAVKNALTQDQAVFRSALIPSLLADAKLNLNRLEKDLRLFEIGHCYTAAGEQDVVGILLTGYRRADWRSAQKIGVDFFDLKGAITHLCSGLHCESPRFAISRDAIFCSGESADFFVSGRKVGKAGRVHPDILKDWDIRQSNVYYAQIVLDDLRPCVPDGRAYRPYSEYPAIVRDVSLAVAKDVPYQKARDIAVELGGDLLKEVNFVEQYLGEKIPAGQRGIVFSLVYRSSQRTLTEEEINKIHQAILDALSARLGAVVR